MQVELVNEEVTTGKWETVNQSGALPVQEKEAILERVRKLKEAVLFAREKANEQEVTRQEVGKKLFAYLWS